jgi:group I intron endonuclease
MYIGQTRESFLRRYFWHWWSLKSGQHSNKQLQEDWIKFGESLFTYSVLEVIDKDDTTALNNKEQYYIKQCKDTDLCYNILEGGNTSRKDYAVGLARFRRRLTVAPAR